MVSGLVAISIPSFLFGLLLLYSFAFRLKLFPVGGYGSPAHLVLPALTVALPWAAWYGIVLRSNMLDTVSLDFARTAAAKGLGPWAIAWRHLLPNALLSVVTMLGMDLAALLTGLALVEYIFGWPGIGWQALQAAQRFDVPMIMGSVLFGALLIGLANLIVDLVYGWLDPRVRMTTLTRTEAARRRAGRRWLTLMPSPAGLRSRRRPSASLRDPGRFEEGPAADQPVEGVVVDVLAAEGDRLLGCPSRPWRRPVDRQLLDLAVGGDALGVGLDRASACATSSSIRCCSTRHR